MVFGKPVEHNAAVQSKAPVSNARHYHRAQCRCGYVGSWRVYRLTAELDAEQHVKSVVATTV